MRGQYNRESSRRRGGYCPGRAPRSPLAQDQRLDADLAKGAWLAGPGDGGGQDCTAILGTGIDWFDLKNATGTMPHEQLMKTIGLYGTQVVPRVRELLATEAVLV